MKLTPLLLAGLLTAPLVRAAGPAPKSWSVAIAETIMKRNPGTPQDCLARWSYWKGYTLKGFEMLWQSTGDRRYFDFIKRQIDPFIDEKGNLAGVRLDSLDNVMAGNIVVALYDHTHDARYLTAATAIRVLNRKEFAPVVANGYRAITANARLDGEGLVDIHNACDGVCVQANYADYVNYPKTVNAKEAVAGFLWATAIVEKPALAKNRKR